MTAGAGSVLQLMVCQVENTASTQRFVVVFWAAGTLCSKMPNVRQRIYVSLQNLMWIGRLVGCQFFFFSECMRVSLDFRVPCVPQDV